MIKPINYVMKAHAGLLINNTAIFTGYKYYSSTVTNNN